MLSAYLERAAATWPDRPAVIEATGARISYADLEELSARVRDRLRAAGVRPGDRVGICLPKTIDSVAAIFGALRAGGAYVPVDPSGPPERNGSILGDCEVGALVVDERNGHRLLPRLAERGVAPEALIVPGPGGGRGIDATLGSPHPERSASVDDGALAYILYTSGSTGEPKGVMLSHGNARAFVDWAVEQFRPAPEDRFASHAPFHFDLSIFDLYVPISSGATLVLIPERLAREPLGLAALISAQRVSVWYSTPSVLVFLSRFGRLERHDFSAMRSVLFAGEVFPVGHLRRLQECWSAARYFNLYGPTETNVCTFQEVPCPVPGDRTEAYPIGRPCASSETVVISPEGEPVEPGVEGELCVRGPAVMQGYWNRPGLTRDAFVALGEGEPWYRTGDRVIRQPDGGHVFVGRRDRMVKRRGHRVELGEIEACLQQHPAVTEVAVVAPSEEDGVMLHAHIVRESDAPLSIIALKRFCAERLPAYMVPDRFDFRAQLPRTSTDKIDYRSLQKAG